jgi:hypothetical protein
MAAVTAVAPGVGFPGSPGSVASSAINTYRSRSIETITPASSDSAPASARTRPSTAWASSTAP